MDSGKPALAGDARLPQKADDIVRGIEARLRRRRRRRPFADKSGCAAATARRLREVAHALLFVTYRQRTMVGLSLMASQAFFYNAIFFTYALILTDFYHAPADRVGWYILPFAAGNLLGPLAAWPAVRHRRPQDR